MLTLLVKRRDELRLGTPDSGRRSLGRDFAPATSRSPTACGSSSTTPRSCGRRSCCRCLSRCTASPGRNCRTARAMRSSSAAFRERRAAVEDAAAGCAGPGSAGAARADGAAAGCTEPWLGDFADSGARGQPGAGQAARLGGAGRRNPGQRRRSADRVATDHRRGYRADPGQRSAIRQRRDPPQPLAEDPVRGARHSDRQIAAGAQPFVHIRASLARHEAAVDLYFEVVQELPYDRLRGRGAPVLVLGMPFDPKGRPPIDHLAHARELQ